VSEHVQDPLPGMETRQELLARIAELEAEVAGLREYRRQTIGLVCAHGWGAPPIRTLEPEVIPGDRT
jgi:hypothetical protein